MSSTTTTPRRDSLSSSSSTVVDFQTLRKCARNELVHRLEMACGGGRADLFIEDTLMKPLDRLAGASLLKEHGVDKIFRFESTSVQPIWGDVAECRIYLLRPTMTNAKYVADHVAASERNGRSIDGQEKKYVVLFWPRKLHVCEMIFEQQGVYKRAELDEFNPFFIPLDTDLLSLELPEFFYSTYLDGTNVWFKTIVQSLLQVQSVYDGRFTRIYGIGRAAEQVAKLFSTLSEEQASNSSTTASSLTPSTSPFSHVFLFDRDLDYASIFLSCLTYEALVDDVFAINCGFTELPSESSTSTNQQQPQQSKPESSTAKLLLSDDSDPIYSSIRHQHFSCVLDNLKWKVRDLQGEFDKRHQFENVTDFKQFVSQDLKKLKQNHRLLTLHIGACESIMGRKSKEHFEEQLRQEHAILGSFDYKDSIGYIEDTACQQTSESTTLSLTCLLSLTQNGLSSKEYQSLRRQYLHAYGHKHLTTFFNLKKLGILCEKVGGVGGMSVPMASQVPSMMHSVVSSIPTNFSTFSSSMAAGAASITSGGGGANFQNICKKLNLRPEVDVDLKTQSHPSYVFNGAYTPIICEVVDRSLKSGFLKDELAKTFGRSTSFMKETDISASGTVMGVQTALAGTVGRPLERRHHDRRDPCVLVYFLGGVTYAEMAALKWIGKQRQCRIVVATTHVINRDRFLKGLAEKM